MNPGPSEVASDVVKTLGGSPALLALLALNAVGISAAVWYLNGISTRNAEIMKVILAACLATLPTQP